MLMQLPGCDAAVSGIQRDGFGWCDRVGFCGSFELVQNYWLEMAPLSPPRCRDSSRSVALSCRGKRGRHGAGIADARGTGRAQSTLIGGREGVAHGDGTAGPYRPNPNPNPNPNPDWYSRPLPMEGLKLHRTGSMQMPKISTPCRPVSTVPTPQGRATATKSLSSPRHLLATGLA